MTRPIHVVLDALVSGDWAWRANATDPTRWTAQCPAHPDDTPSLSLREVEGGKVLVHCFAGCGTADVLHAIGLSWADLSPNGSRAECVRQEAAQTFAATKEHTSDLGNARRLVGQHGRDLRYCHPLRAWLVWDGRRWRARMTGARSSAERSKR